MTKSASRGVVWCEKSKRALIKFATENGFFSKPPKASSTKQKGPRSSNMSNGFYLEAAKITGKKPSQCKSKLQKELRRRTRTSLKFRKATHPSNSTFLKGKKAVKPKLKSTRSRLLQNTASIVSSDFTNQFSTKGSFDEDTTHVDQTINGECDNSQTIFLPDPHTGKRLSEEQTIVFDQSDPFLGFQKNGPLSRSVCGKVETNGKVDSVFNLKQLALGNFEQKGSIYEKVSVFYVPTESNQIDWIDSNEGDLNFNRIPDPDNACSDSEPSDAEDVFSRLTSDHLFQD